MPKFFVNKEFVYDNYIKIEGENFNHISNVLRAKIGQEIIICDGNLVDYNCKICEINKKFIKAEIIDKYINKNEPNIKIILFQALPKADKMEMVIQKCIEIGVDKIIPILTDNTVIKLNEKSDKKILRWNKIAESAAKQCGRGKIPEIENIINFKDAVEKSKLFDNSIIPYEKEDKYNIKNFINNFKGKSIAVFIGPEGGFSEDEIKYASENNIFSVTLGKRILRTETAGLVASVILLYELGELG